MILLAAIVLVLIGLYFVERQRAVPPSGSSVSWQFESGYIETPDSAAQSIENDPAPVTPDISGQATLTIPSASTTTQQKTTATDGTFDYNAMLAQMRGVAIEASPKQQANSSFEALIDAFEFTPTITAPAPRVLSPEQQAIFAYGNVIGTRLRGFAAVNVNMAQTLSDQMNDRQSRSKGNAVRDLGLRYKSLGEGILAIGDVPSSFDSAHKKLGESYIQLGEALSAVPDATGDQALVTAITLYNGKADAYTNAFVSMVTLFSAHEVTFEESDAGSVFSFRR